MSKPLIFTGCLLLPLSILFKIARDNGDILNGSSSSTVLSDSSLQLSLAGFCLSPMVSQIEGTIEHSATKNTTYEYSFADHGGINEADYDKGSIYSYLYSLYANLGQIKSEQGEDFEFTFNTWGISPAPTGTPVLENGIRADDPQRHGKASYSYFTHSAELRDFLAKKNGDVQIVEIGCGTGAGASHLTQNVFPRARYMGIDMQRGAIETCNRLHASDRLQCVHIASGVGNGPDGKVPLADGKADIVIILETHIAEQDIGPEEKLIFAEIARVLRPGGYFLWGNAIPTDVWFQAEEYLPTAGFSTVDRWNNTAEAVRARDEDAPRVKKIMDTIRAHHMAFSIPYFGATCWDVVDRLLRNFYRDPATAMYDKMVRGYDSYMHYVFKHE